MIRRGFFKTLTAAALAVQCKLHELPMPASHEDSEWWPNVGIDPAKEDGSLSIVSVSIDGHTFYYIGGQRPIPDFLTVKDIGLA